MATETPQFNAATYGILCLETCLISPHEVVFSLPYLPLTDRSTDVAEHDTLAGLEDAVTVDW
jgi:hypothetical protein